MYSTETTHAGIFENQVGPPSVTAANSQKYSPSPATQPSCNSPGQPEPFLATSCPPTAPAFADSISIEMLSILLVLWLLLH